MAEFTVGEYDYKSSRMSALEQDRLVRRLAPILPLFAEYSKVVEEEAKRIGEQADAAETQSLMQLIVQSEAGRNFIDRASKVLADMDDDKSTFVYRMCLSKCQRRKVGDSGSWSPVWNDHGNCPQHIDINFGVMLRITMEVIKAEVGNFF